MLSAWCRRTLAVGVGSAALLLSAAAAADEPVAPDETDPGAYPPASARAQTIATGALVAGVWYGGALGASYLWPDAPGASELRIPVAGPWMALADTGCPAREPNCSTFFVVLRAILTTIDGVGQVGGLAVIAEGLLLPTADSATSTPRPAARGAARVTPVPYVAGRDGVGLGLIGVF